MKSQAFGISNLYLDKFVKGSIVLFLIVYDISNSRKLI